MSRDLSVNRYSKDRLDSRVAMPIEALSEADLDRLEQSKIPEKTKKLDHLVPGRWQTALDLRRRPQMSQEIHSWVGPYWGPRNERKNIFARLSDVYILNAVPSRQMFAI